MVISLFFIFSPFYFLFRFQLNCWLWFNSYRMRHGNIHNCTYTPSRIYKTIDYYKDCIPLVRIYVGWHCACVFIETAFECWTTTQKREQKHLQWQHTATTTQQISIINVNFVKRQMSHLLLIKCQITLFRFTTKPKHHQNKQQTK